MSTRAAPQAPAGPPPGRSPLVEHRPFLVLLALGVLVRVAVTAAFTPGLMMSDAPTYLDVVDTPVPNPDRPVGYALLLLVPVTAVSDTVLAVVLAQHALGLGTAALLYALLRRWRVGRWPAALAAAPLLLDSLQLILEHAPLSDTTFVALVVAGLAVLAWRPRPTVALALGAGLLLGASATVRQVGTPLVLAGALHCLLVGRTWRARSVTALVLAAGFALPVGAYATWYQSHHGAFALSDVGGRSAYMRTTAFVDCAQLDVPRYQRVLCPPQPRGERLDPTNYGWYDVPHGGTAISLDPPGGTTRDEAMRSFAAAAVRAQPLDYAAVVARDVALNFDLWRGNRAEYDTAFKWRFGTYLDRAPTAYTSAGYAEHGGDQLSVRRPLGDVLAGYSRAVYLPGPVLLACLGLAVAAALGAGRARASGMRALCLLFAVCGLGLLLVPAVGTQFVWRYQLPALALLPAAAALAWTALRPGAAGPGPLTRRRGLPEPRRPRGPSGRRAPAPAARERG
ncbi:MAG: hypothetical protein AVDCRST_MAG35-2887 [uncultured Quadrisphaera sp.]|uniref:Glycosyltransferase RgtA/B/C/D-like domain-containing protein n=1 Tax=uncultured Quadrisphaera sp. TaxID=904978 RepID=A0A6J4QET6_9ACTN|nr:MAG: hypothetical protein AVDCRST_MAG35-2887 [uncultured Quadrisphaera sp.]